MALGRPKPHSAREIRERRENIQMLMSRGMNQVKIARELGVARQTIIRDIHYINEMSRHGLYDMAKTSATLYFNCIQGLDECLDVCWRIYDNVDNYPEINQWHKIAAIKLAASINEKKFNIFVNGPAIMQLDHMRDKVDEIRKQASEDDNTFFRKSLTYKDLPHNDENSNKQSDSNLGSEIGSP